MDTPRENAFDTAVVGAGLAGLVAANRLADAGRSVIVLDGLGASGGRARTSLLADHLVNQGPHALYVGGHASRALRHLGVPVEGEAPPTRGTRGLYDDRLHLLPAGPVSLLRTSLLSPVEKMAVGALLARLPRLDPVPLDEVTVADWIDSVTRREAVRNLLAALFRLATYADCPELQSAGAALRQLSMALDDGVLYLHGGWQSLVDGLTTRAVAAGVVFRYDGSVTGILGDSPRLTIRTATEDLSARNAVVAAGGPETAERLTGATGLVEAAGPPTRAAVLDLALDRQPDHQFVLGIDRPVYFSVHGPPARLAPAGQAIASAARYLHPDADDAAGENRSALEDIAAACGVQASSLLADRYLHSMTVAHGTPLAERGGLAGRPGIEAADRPGVLIAGDWVGPEGMLADAAASSAWAAADTLLGTP
ncbi:MAG: FAD-dependent oxidoreductase [Acidimicrobiales bacterium]|nr:FAD-dependent oxidoreductase [Acidimicrobiales bacterium]